MVSLCRKVVHFFGICICCAFYHLFVVLFVELIIYTYTHVYSCIQLSISLSNTYTVEKGLEKVVTEVSASGLLILLSRQKGCMILFVFDFTM